MMKKNENIGLQLSMTAIAHASLGVSLIQQGKFSEARAELHKSIKEYRKLIKRGYNLRLKLVEALLLLGTCLGELHELHNIEDIYQEAFEILQKTHAEGQTFSIMVSMMEGIARWYSSPPSPLRPDILKAFKIATIGLNWLDSMLGRVSGFASVPIEKNFDLINVSWQDFEFSRVSKLVKGTLIEKNLPLYQLATDLALELKQPEQAYITLERSKTRVLTELLREQNESISPQVSSKELQERYYDLRKELSSLEKELSKPGHPLDSTILEKWRTTRQDFGNLLTEIAPEDPVFVGLLQPKVLTRRDFTPLLDLNELVIAFEQGPEELRLYAITKRGGVQTPITVTVTRPQLEEAVTGFDMGIKDPETIYDAIDKLCDWLNTHLAPSIQEMLAGQRQPIDKITFISHQLWHRLPIHLLTIEEVPLTLNSRYQLRHLPSLQVLGLISDRPPATEGDGCIIADPCQDSLFADLRGQQIQELRARYHFQDKLLTGKQATLESVYNCLLSAKHIHFAGHGEFREHLQSGLLLANQEKLTAMDLFTRLRIPNTRLVVLGACETAQIQTSLVDEYMGLTSSFLFAGAHNVLASLWRVDDNATLVFMECFYKRLLKDRLTLPLALQQAQQELQQSPNFSHPYYWGAFILIGEGR